MKKNNVLGEVTSEDLKWNIFLEQIGGWDNLVGLAASTLSGMKSQVKLSPYVEDLLQDALATLYAGIDSYDPERPPQPWAKTVMKNRLVREVERIEREHGKQHKKQKNESEEDDHEPEPLPDIAIGVTNEELVDRIYDSARDEKMVAILRKVSRGVPLKDSEWSKFYRFRDKIRKEVSA